MGLLFGPRYATANAIGFTYQSPANFAVFSGCSLINTYQPTFSWTTTETFTSFTLLFSTSTDFSAKGVVVYKAIVRGTINSWTPPIGIWKKIMTASYNKGSIRDIYWKLVGTKPDKTTSGGDVRQFRIDLPQAVTINGPAPGETFTINPSPTFDFYTNCNVKFRLEFSPLPDFSDLRKIRGYIFSTRDPNVEKEISRTLTYGQWSAVVHLVGPIGYFRIRSWDGINREMVSETRLFNIKSSLIGKWYVETVERYTIIFPGYRDTWVEHGDVEVTIRQDATVEVYDPATGNSMTGEWTQQGNKFTIFLDYDTVESFYEYRISSEEGVATELTVTSFSLTGTENAQRGTVSGKMTLKVKVDLIGEPIHGTASLSITFTGTK